MTGIPHNGEQASRLQAEKVAIEQAMCEAVGEAVQTHKRLGLPMVEWHDGQIVLVPAEQLDSDDSAPLQ